MIWTLETQGRQRWAWEKVKDQRVRVSFFPRMRKNSKASSAGQLEGIKLGRVKIGPIQGSWQRSCFGEAGPTGSKLNHRETDGF